MTDWYDENTTVEELKHLLPRMLALDEASLAAEAAPFIEWAVSRAVISADSSGWHDLDVTAGPPPPPPPPAQRLIVYLRGQGGGMGQAVRWTLCDQANKKAISNTLDAANMTAFASVLIPLVTSVAPPEAITHGHVVTPATSLAVLALKIGLNKICADYPSKHENREVTGDKDKPPTKRRRSSAKTKEESE